MKEYGDSTIYYKDGDLGEAYLRQEANFGFCPSSHLKKFTIFVIRKLHVYLNSSFFVVAS